MNKFLFLLVGMFAFTFSSTSYSQLKVVSTGDIEAASGLISLGSDLGFKFKRTPSGSSRFEHSGTSQYIFNALDNAAIAFYTNGTNRMVVRQATGDLEVKTGGAFKPGGGPFTALSDRRSKNNINEYSDGLAEILQINPVSFQYNAETGMNPGKEYIGVVAQEIQKVAPYTVADFDLRDDEDNVVDTYLSFDPNALTYMLINAVQEQNELINAQADKISQLEEAVNTFGTSEGKNVTNVELSAFDLAEIGQNAPNPFANSTSISYVVPTDAKTATINIFSTSGKILKSVDIEHVGEGTLEITADSLPSGTYSYQLTVDGKRVQTNKMVVSK